ncbi:TrmH family RNA methyltransferase [Lentibacillus salinarum]|uniref:TrmH family RNA methyltransferase n=1 Tax=Lentibacillus salinarum TaxID=446820 RepID=A0ABW3ZWS5_9BACI
MITSLQNPKVKQWLKLHKRKGRKQSGMFLVEGFHLVEEAVQSNWEIDDIIVEEGIDCPDWCRAFMPVLVNNKVMQQITRTESPQGIAAVVKMTEPKVGVRDKILIIDSIQDPGNLGTMIRTADAAGFDMVVLGEGTVDVYNDKVVRATQGSLFHVPIVHAILTSMIPVLQTEGVVVWASALADAIPFHQAKAGDKAALVIGNEGAGIDDAIIALADQTVNIPIYGQAESLNASVAAGILMYSLIR